MSLVCLRVRSLCVCVCVLECNFVYGICVIQILLLSLSSFVHSLLSFTLSLSLSLSLSLRIRSRSTDHLPRGLFVSCRLLSCVATCPVHRFDSLYVRRTSLRLYHSHPPTRHLNAIANKKMPYHFISLSLCLSVCLPHVTVRSFPHISYTPHPSLSL